MAPKDAETTSRMVHLAQRTGPWGFAIIYLGWAHLFWIPVLGSETSVWAGTNLILFLIGGASPLLAALALAGLTGGGRGHWFKPSIAHNEAPGFHGLLRSGRVCRSFLQLEQSSAL